MNDRPYKAFRRPWVALAAGVMLFAPLAAVAWQVGAIPGRARPPRWTAGDLDVFFPDARKQLVGERPLPGTAVAVATSDPSVSPPPATAPATAPEGAFAWSALISADVLEDEIKAINLRLGGALSSASEFKLGGFKPCRDEFMLLAVLFRVAGQYDGRVRWKDDADRFAAMFADAGAQCRVGTDASYAVARRRKEDLDLLVRGERLQVASAAGVEASRGDVTPFMRRIEAAYRDRITPALASEDKFAQAADEIGHESQILSVLAVEIGRDRYEFSDEEFYREHAAALRAAARGLWESTERRDYNRAAAAGAAMGKSCTECHADYRA